MEKIEIPQSNLEYWKQQVRSGKMSREQFDRLEIQEAQLRKAHATTPD